MDPTSFSCIVMISDMHFEMENECTLELEASTSPWYRVFELKAYKMRKSLVEK